MGIPPTLILPAIGVALILYAGAEIKSGAEHLAHGVKTVIHHVLHP